MNRSRVEPGQDSDRRIKVVFGGVALAYTGRAKRVPDIVGKGDPGTWGW